MDLREADVSFDIINTDLRMIEAYSREGLRRSHIYLWVQDAPRPIDSCVPDPSIGENCTRQSNYILTARDDPMLQFDRENNAGANRVKLAEYSETEWTCLGRGRNVKYDCMPVADVLKNVYAIGFIAAPVRACITNKPWEVGGFAIPRKMIGICPSYLILVIF